jgi:hypothetical protein
VLDDPGAIRAALTGTVLEGLTLCEGPSRSFVIGELTSEQLLEGWRAARAALPRAGRWPLAVHSGVAEDLPERSESELASFAQAVEGTDPWTIFTFNHEEGPIEVHDIPGWWLPDPELAVDVARYGPSQLSRTIADSSGCRR